MKPDKAHEKVSTIFRLITETFAKLYTRAKINEAREDIKNASKVMEPLS